MEIFPTIDKDQFPFPKIQEIRNILTNSKLFGVNKKFCSSELSRSFLAFEYRYTSLQFQERRYYDITHEYGDTPPTEPINYRFYQDEAIFLFFTCSVSLFDCYAYSLYAACSHLDPKIVKLDCYDDGKYVYFYSVVQKVQPLNNLLNNSGLLDDIKKIKEEPQFNEIKIFRNYLYHRAHLPRTVYLSTHSKINSRINTIDGLDVEIKENALQEYKKWIDISNESLLEGFHLFLTDNF